MELSTKEAKDLIDEIAAMQIFYINIGGGEPMIRRDFFELIEHAVRQKVGVKFSTNGTRIDEEAAERLAAIDYLDIQISIDGADAATSDRIRGAGSYDQGRRAMDNLKAAIVKACWNDQQVQRAYRECGLYYDFLITPCRPATPQHKGKVESGVHYVTRNAMAGMKVKPRQIWKA